MESRTRRNRSVQGEAPDHLQADPGVRVDEQGKVLDLGHTIFVSDSGSTSRNGKNMKIAPAVKRSIYNLVIVVSIGIMLFTSVLLLAQVRAIGQQNHQIAHDVKDQTTVIQKYLRCLLLIPQKEYATIETRIVAIDRCVEESIKRANETNPPDQQISNPEPTL